MASKLSSTNLKKAWKMKGTTKKNAFKRAWSLQKGKKSSVKTKKNKTKKSGSRKMAKKKGNRKTPVKVIHIPLALTGGVLGSLTVKAPSGSSILENILAGDIATAGYNARELFTGIDANGNFNKDFLMKGWKPIIIGLVGHVLAQKLGLNKALYTAQKGFPIKVGL